MKPFSNLRHTILLHVTKTDAAISILQQGKIRIGRNRPEYTEMQKQMLGEGVYLGRCYSNCISKVRQLNLDKGTSVVVSIVKLGGVYETKEKQRFLNSELLQSEGLNYHSTRCLGCALQTGTEYCVYDQKRVIPIFAWVQNPEGTFLLARSNDGIYKYDDISVDSLIISMTNNCIFISEGNNPPFNSFSYDEPLIGKKVIIFPHHYDFLFGKIIQRNPNLGVMQFRPKTKYVDYNYEDDEEIPARNENGISNSHGPVKTEANKPVDVVFVIDSTSSMIPVFNKVISRVKQIHDFILDNFGLPSLYSGAVINRNQENNESEAFPLIDEALRKEELEQENLYFEDLEELREEQLSWQGKVLYPLNKNSVIDLYPMNNESFPSFKPTLSQLLRRLSYARYTVSNIAESFLNDPSRTKFRYNDYHGDTNEEGNKFIISRRGLKLTYEPNDKGQMTFKKDNSSLVLYYSKTKVETYLKTPPLTYPLITELQKVIPYGSNSDNENDWVTALKMALNDVSWREQSWKLIVWISDKNSKVQDQSKLYRKVEKMAASKINFLGINISENNDGGCLKTFLEMKKISELSNGNKFIIQNFDEPVDNSLDCLVNDFNEMEFETIE